MSEDNEQYISLVKSEVAPLGALGTALFNMSNPTCLAKAICQADKHQQDLGHKEKHLLSEHETLSVLKMLRARVCNLSLTKFGHSPQVQVEVEKLKQANIMEYYLCAKNLAKACLEANE